MNKNEYSLVIVMFWNCLQLGLVNLISVNVIFVLINGTLFTNKQYFTFLGRHLELTSPITSSTGGHSSHPSHLATSNQQQQLPSSSSLHLHAPHTPSQSSALKSPASAAALFSHFYEGGSNPVTHNPRLQPPSHIYPRTTSKLEI